MADPIRRDKPIINVIGTVTHTGTRTELAGWHITFCRRACRCHCAPWTMQGRIDEGADGSLGLHKYRACYCCEAWTVQELAGFANDLATIETMTNIGGLLS